MLTVCVSALQSWNEICRDIGVDPLEAARLADQARDGVIPLNHFVAALEVIAGRSGTKTLGWAVGEHYDLRLLGDVGSAILSSATLGSALRRFVDYFSLLQDATEFELRCERGGVFISYRILDPEIWPRQQDALFTLSIVTQLLRRAIGFEWDELRVRLEGDELTVAAELCRRTGIACDADAEVNMICFPASSMDLPLVPNGAVISPDYKALNRTVVRKRRAMSIVLRVRTAVYRYMGTEIDQQRIAVALGMSGRTLRRKLAEENVSFRQILYGCRMRQAAHQFRLGGDVSIADTAMRLGYSEHSAFTRAFSRWCGVSPHRYHRDSVSVPTISSR